MMACLGVGFTVLSPTTQEANNKSIHLQKGKRGVLKEPTTTQVGENWMSKIKLKNIGLILTFPPEKKHKLR